MNWTNVKLIFCREVRDQLRDRRTLFMIVVLPILLYPLLGMSFFQIFQFVREQPTKVLLLGYREVASLPTLVEQEGDGCRFAARLFSLPARSRLLDVRLSPSHMGQNYNLSEYRADGYLPHLPDVPAPADTNAGSTDDEMASQARQLVQKGDYETVIVFPNNFSERLADVRRQLSERRKLGEPLSEDESRSPVPSPMVYYNTAKEKSAIAYTRVSEVLRRWTDEVVRDNLEAGGVHPSAARPFSLASDDVAASSGQRGAAVWAKVLPFLLLIWALTGAFYPAVDLCAGEKERGTLETLLSSPAERSEIVWGKLFTIMLFSIATAVLNLVSMGITGELVLSQLPEFGSPPKLAMLWLFAALIPVSALFSALCLALAAFARSTKEGQYYLMPLVMVAMPLVLLPMSPGFDLTLGNCLIPITGVMLVLRSMLEGNVWEALPYIPIVAGVTLIGCLFAIRWAIDQFNTESVLFRESERLDLGLWLRSLLRDREDTPTVAAAVFCGLLILLINFFMSVTLAKHLATANLLVLALITQIAVIATPALLMTVMFTRSPRKTLLLRMPPLLSVPAAVLLAVSLHPSILVLKVAVQKLYPMSEVMTEHFKRLAIDTTPLWQLLLVIAVLPAVCEELAFRGFILSGLRHLGHKRRAILITSIFFGVTHTILQQSIITFLVGVVIGYLAVQTGSLLPGVVFHMVSNALTVLVSLIPAASVERHPIWRWIWTDAGEHGVSYQQYIVAIGGLIVVGILLWLRSLPYSRSQEESLQETIEQNMVHSAAS